ncbi:E3 ligase immediate-early protein [White spot syndrome virus]|uniref:E3 ligase immediate-early protein n=1 Tax=White spot syndrome virus TaxID=342409 RepID=A0A2R2XF58_9VIRU|nr:E3 ligase immediate-early protein [White spot syndrome virus]
MAAAAVSGEGRISADLLLLEQLTPDGDVIRYDSEQYTKPRKIFGDKSVIETIGHFLIHNHNQGESYQIASSVLEKFPALLNCIWNGESGGMALWKALYRAKKYRLLNSLLVHKIKNWPSVAVIPIYGSVCDREERPIIMSEIIDKETLQTICKSDIRSLLGMMNAKHGTLGGNFLHFYARSTKPFENFQYEAMGANAVLMAAEAIYDGFRDHGLNPSEYTFPGLESADVYGNNPVEIAISGDDDNMLLNLICNYGVSYEKTRGRVNRSLLDFLKMNTASKCLSVLKFVEKHFKIESNTPKGEFEEKAETCVNCLDRNNVLTKGSEQESYKLSCGHFLHVKCLRNICIVSQHLRCEKCLKRFDESILRKCTPNLNWWLTMPAGAGNEEEICFMRNKKLVDDFRKLLSPVSIPHFFKNSRQRNLDMLCPYSDHTIIPNKEDPKKNEDGNRVRVNHTAISEKQNKEEEDARIKRAVDMAVAAINEKNKEEEDARIKRAVDMAVAATNEKNKKEEDARIKRIIDLTVDMRIQRIVDMAIAAATKKDKKEEEKRTKREQELRADLRRAMDMVNEVQKKLEDMELEKGCNKDEAKNTSNVVSSSSVVAYSKEIVPCLGNNNNAVIGMTSTNYSANNTKNNVFGSPHKFSFNDASRFSNIVETPKMSFNFSFKT